MLIRLLIFAGLFYLAFRILRSLLTPSQRHRPSQPSRPDTNAVSDMVQDPHCGVYVSKKNALAAQTRKGVYYFCSEECRNKFLEKQ